MQRERERDRAMTIVSECIIYYGISIKFLLPVCFLASYFTSDMPYQLIPAQLDHCFSSYTLFGNAQHISGPVKLTSGPF